MMTRRHLIVVFVASLSVFILRKKKCEPAKYLYYIESTVRTRAKPNTTSKLCQLY